MKLNRQRGIALVITLLMLSVITFLAIAFLAITRRDRAAVTTSLDVGTARAMSEAALARAQSEIIARMMANTDILSYDYAVSHNFISPGGFSSISNTPDTNNVNYDFTSDGAPFTAAEWAQNIANLMFDPRPPVFIQTNVNSPSNDFRFWVDVNENGKFETNGYLPVIADDGTQVQASGGVPLTNFFPGEPEWIGVLRFPEYPHSATNPFIGRYAYMALPIGKTLDFNFIHNYSKGNLGMPAFMKTNADGFVRDQGVGSWEINLAALLRDVNPTYYVPNGSIIGITPYDYLYPAFLTPSTPNSGFCFDDAVSFLSYRYSTNFGARLAAFNPYPYPLSLAAFFTNATPFKSDGIDEYCLSNSTTAPFDYTASDDPDTDVTKPWPGSFTTNMLYDIQELFDPSKSSAGFVNRLLGAGSRTNSNDRYTFQRLLNCIGTGSSAEYGVYVYDNDPGTNGYPETRPPGLLRTKVNLNYDNTAQIKAGPYTPMPTNLSSWSTPLTLFTNAADILLRSQTFPLVLVPGVTTNSMHFGITNIPIYNSTNASIRYSASLHRMLQLAANICEATTNGPMLGNPQVRVPTMYRPIFSQTKLGNVTTVSIVGYTNVTDAAEQLRKGLVYMSPTNVIQPNDNVWGIPWVIGAVKGLPAFTGYGNITAFCVTRKLEFTRSAAGATLHTNQYYELSMTNAIAMQAWNAYSNRFPHGVSIIATNLIVITLSNSANWSTNITFTNNFGTNLSPNAWLAWAGQQDGKGGVLCFTTNCITLPIGYFSEARQMFVNYSNTGGSFLTIDKPQSKWPTRHWYLGVTNYVDYTLFDNSTVPPTLLDFANVGTFGTNLDLSQILFQQVPQQVFSPIQDDAGAVVPQGDLQQIGIGLNQISFPAWDVAVHSNDIANFTSNMVSKTALDFWDPFFPTAIIILTNMLEANDPLVHYTYDDLYSPQLPNGPAYLAPANYFPTNTVLLTKPTRCEPWPESSSAAGSQSIKDNMTFKDPWVTRPDRWDFPTNKFPSVGWLGRVHRGTPWQTIFLKADPDPGNNQEHWVTQWVSTMDTYPTNDYDLIDLFTAAPNDAAATGLLSVNQTNEPAWAAVLSGIIVPTNLTGGVAISPTDLDAGGQSLISDMVNSINSTRTNEPNGLFHKIGYILKNPSLTISNSYWVADEANKILPSYNDEVVEAIPQKILSLLKVGEPQFVIYSWGQALRPKNLYLSSGQNFKLCTNYQITGEFVTRTVCRVRGDAAASVPTVEIQSSTIQPGQ